VLFPCLMLTIVFIYFMGGLIFYQRARRKRGRDV